MSDAQTNGGKAARKPARSSRQSKASATEEAAELGGRATHFAEEALHNSQGVFEHASKLVATLQQGHEELGQRLAEGSAARPYVAMGAAAGVGFVLGGGLTVALTRRLVVFGGRMAMSMAMRKIVENAAHVSV